MAMLTLSLHSINNLQFARSWRFPDAFVRFINTSVLRAAHDYLNASLYTQDRYCLGADIYFVTEIFFT